MPQDLSWLPDQPKAAKAQGMDPAFQQWYGVMSKRHGLNPNPDAPEQLYDYRAAFKAGAKPDASGHWPSTFKKPGHPNEIVGGFNTRTGERVPGQPQASEAELVKLGWEPETAKRLSASKSDLSWLPDQPNNSRRPVSAEDFMTPEDIANRDMTALDVVKGFGKGAARSVAGMVNMAAQSRMVPGLSPESLPPQVVDRFTPQYTNQAQELGGTLETVFEIGLPVIRGAQAVPGLVKAGVRKFGEPLARSMASETPMLTQARQKVAKAVLSRVLDFGKKPVAGARVVPRQADDFNAVISDALEELRAPAPAPSVQLPPQSGLPAGYSPRTSAPAPSAAPAQPSAPQGRLVKPHGGASLEDELASVLEELRAPAQAPVQLPPPVTTAATPRTTAPRAAAPRPAPARAPSAEPSAAAPPQRAYFLKSPEEIAAAGRSAPESVTPTGSITIADLPKAWKQHTGQDLFPTTGAEAKEIRAALMQEIKDRGLSIGEALQMVSTNKSIPTVFRAQLIRSLSRAK